MNINDEMFYGLILSLAAFLFSMVLTPFYTHFAYKYKFWKKQKKTTVDGKTLPVMTKLHAHKFTHVFPTMAGLVGVIAVTVVTWIFNLDRAQTWLPLVGFLGGALVGTIDDVINIFGSGRGAAGLRGPVKFLLITIVGVTLGWYFAVKLGWTSILIPFYGDFEIGVVAMMTNSFLLLPVICLPAVIETLSSLIQLISKKLFHKKIFVSAPLHHHLEAKGWGEAKIVMRFWIIAGVCAIIGVFIAATGGAI